MTKEDGHPDDAFMPALKSTRKQFLLGGGLLAGAGLLSMTAAGRAGASVPPAAGSAVGSPRATPVEVNVRDFGASGSDFQTTGSMAAGSAGVSVAATGDFSPGDGIYVAGAGPSGSALVSVVVKVNKPTGVLTLQDPAQTAASGATVQHDDTAAIRRAFDSLGSPPQGCLSFPGGLYRTSTTIEFDLGHEDAVETYPNAADYPNTSWFQLDMAGRIAAAPGVGRALYIHSGFFPIVQVNLDGGGQWGDFGLEVYDLVAAQISVFAKAFAGTALHVTGGGVDANTRVSVSCIDKLYAVACGRALLFEGTSGFGLVDDVWDADCANGSVFQNSNDISINHWENLFHQNPGPSGSEVYSLIFKDCAAVHLGTVALGDSANALMLIQDSFGFSIDKFYAVSGLQIFPDGGAIVGLQIVDSTVTLANVLSLNSGTGVYVQGSSVTIGNHEGQTNNTNLRIGPSSASSEARVNVNARYGDEGGSVLGDVIVEPGLTGGYLQLGGGTRNTNSSGSSGIYAVSCQSTAFRIFTWAFVQEHSNVAGGIGHPDIKNVVLAGGAIEDGVAQTS